MKNNIAALKNKKAGFTLVEIMIVVLIIGILLAIAIPNFIQAREASRSKSCIANLKQIDSAKQQCAMDNKIAATDTTSQFYIDGTGTATASPYKLVDITGATGYLRSIPSCPAAGLYTAGNVATSPTCSISAGVTAGDYSPTGRFYHGL